MIYSFVEPVPESVEINEAPAEQMEYVQKISVIEPQMGSFHRASVLEPSLD